MGKKADATCPHPRFSSAARRKGEVLGPQLALEHGDGEARIAAALRHRHLGIIIRPLPCVLAVLEVPTDIARVELAELLTVNDVRAWSLSRRTGGHQRQPRNRDQVCTESHCLPPHSTTCRIWKPPSSSAQRLAIASRGAPLACTTASVPCVASLRTVTSAVTPSAWSGARAAAKARCAASRRSAGLKILPTPVSGICGIGTTCTGTAARSGISLRQNSRSSSGVTSAPGLSCTKAIGTSPA